MTIREFITEYIMNSTKDLQEGDFFIFVGTKDSKQLFKLIFLAERYIITLEANTFVFVDGSLFLISEQKWNDFGIPRDLAVRLNLVSVNMT